MARRAGDRAATTATTTPDLRALRHIALRTTAFDRSLEFYAGPWGLELTTRNDLDGRAPVAYLRGTGEEHHVLELHAAERNGIDHIAFAVASPAEVDTMAETVQRLGLPIVREPGRADRPGGGYHVRFADPEGRIIELSAEVEAVAERDDRARRPRKLAHVVLNTVDIDAACAFYTEVLGLRVSDWSEHQMVFLRCNQDHHCIAFNQGQWTSLNHVAYEVPDLDAFMASIGRLHRAGTDPAWGPGRHGPGNNAFAYFVDPAGLVPEVTADVQRIDEATWVPRVWPRVPELSDLWGTAGPPSPEIRTHMAGEPDPGPVPRADRATDGNGAARATGATRGEP